jgi:hypothetical protein
VSNVAAFAIPKGATNTMWRDRSEFFLSINKDTASNGGHRCVGVLMPVVFY